MDDTWEDEAAAAFVSATPRGACALVDRGPKLGGDVKLRIILPGKPGPSPWSPAAGFLPSVMPKSTEKPEPVEAKDTSENAAPLVPDVAGEVALLRAEIALLRAEVIKSAAMRR